MTEIKLFTIDEVAKNNGANGSNVWIIIKDSVYDVTNYMKDHPGGPELIEDYAGKEATSAFHDAGHSSDALKQLKGMKIGELHPDDRGKNGKKPTPKVVEHKESPSDQNRSFLNVISCGLCG